MTLRSRFHNDEGGTVVLMVALSLVALIGMLVLTFDLGSLVARKRTMVTASDSAALAAARSCAGLPPVVAPEAAADALASANAGAGITGGITAAENCGVPTNPAKVMGSVTVNYAKTFELYFAPLLGVNDATVRSDGSAVWGWTTSYAPTFDAGAKRLYVCKYVAGGSGRKPERLQTGQNPIEVGVSKSRPASSVGTWSFDDKQTWSYYLATSPQGVPPTVADCPTLGVRLVQ
jgi:hypothetical protein